MNRRAWPRPPSGSASRPNGDAVAYVLKTLNTAHGGKLSVARVLAGQTGDGTTFTLRRRGGRPGRRRLQAHRPYHRKARTGGRRRDRCVRQARKRQDRRHAVLRQAAACRRREGQTLSAGAGHRDFRQGAQGRREARPGAQQAGRGRSLDHHRAQSGDARGGAVGPGRDAPARRHRAPERPLTASPSSGASRASATAKPSARASCSAAATRSSRAATASTAT